MEVDRELCLILLLLGFVGSNSSGIIIYKHLCSLSGILFYFLDSILIDFCFFSGICLVWILSYIFLTFVIDSTIFCSNLVRGLPRVVSNLEYVSNPLGNITSGMKFILLGSNRLLIAPFIFTPVTMPAYDPMLPILLLCLHYVPSNSFFAVSSAPMSEANQPIPEVLECCRQT